MSERANLGLATTRELLAELAARIDVDHVMGGGGLDYTTVGGRPEATAGTAAVESPAQPPTTHVDNGYGDCIGCGIDDETGNSRSSSADCHVQRGADTPQPEGPTPVQLQLLTNVLNGSCAYSEDEIEAAHRSMIVGGNTADEIATDMNERLISHLRTNRSALILDSAVRGADVPTTEPETGPGQPGKNDADYAGLAGRVDAQSPSSPRCGALHHWSNQTCDLARHSDDRHRQVALGLSWVGDHRDPECPCRIEVPAGTSPTTPEEPT